MNPTAATLPPLLVEVFGRCHEHPNECDCKDCMTVFDAATEHEYRCACQICQWWGERMPPENEDDPD